MELSTSQWGAVSAVLAGVRAAGGGVDSWLAESVVEWASILTDGVADECHDLVHDGLAWQLVLDVGVTLAEVLDHPTTCDPDCDGECARGPRFGDEPF